MQINIILISTIPERESEYKQIMYADDTTLVSHPEKVGATNIAIEHELNREIQKLTLGFLVKNLS